MARIVAPSRPEALNTCCAAARTASRRNFRLASRRVSAAPVAASMREFNIVQYIDQCLELLSRDMRSAHMEDTMTPQEFAERTRKSTPLAGLLAFDVEAL